jgi:hypothetical protein
MCVTNFEYTVLHFVRHHLSIFFTQLTAVVKYRRSHTDGTADKTSFRKEPLFPSPLLVTGNDANNASQDGSNNDSTASPASPGQLQPKKSLAATLVESTKKESVALVPSDIARLTQRFYPLFNFSLFPHKPPPVARVNQVLFTDAEDGYDLHLHWCFQVMHYSFLFLSSILYP